MRFCIISVKARDGPPTSLGGDGGGDDGLARDGGGGRDDFGGSCLGSLR